MQNGINKFNVVVLIIHYYVSEELQSAANSINFTNIPIFSFSLLTVI